ncbi:D-alanine--D-alanine ligase family protein [Pseudomonas sp. 5P_3.1_Bac2]|uniref:D-alanine--D-alanine ligase family protein n=1 Tax=Pseudomonas sp. 5P_3.1_Bac2 TaxID=2971617 RepID=UPI0021C9666C|nr:D-alanine--D-alanine ligase family protein [Pseudomonas sp. 5P_3.1_Bac2]MCU1717192.1 D-alanine--D-alanine ligase [Pseudomonas sp. 5P_3.1_Bac2]
MSAKIRVVLLFGGRSSEHSISCVTAKNVYDALDKQRYDVLPVGIRANGQMQLVAPEAMDYRLDAPQLPHVIDNGSQFHWPQSSASRQISVTQADGSLRLLGEVDLVFPVLHGPYGEDGTVQGMLELISLPYVGNGVLASALCMDKHFTKLVLAAAGIQVAPGRSLSRNQWQREPELLDSLDAGLNYPLFVKPARAGSSMGVSRVTSKQALPAALETAFAHDAALLIESSVSGREVEIAVLGGRNGTRPRTSSVIGEIVCQQGTFYDFDAKYLGADSVTLHLPAVVTETELKQLQDTAVRAFEATGCTGLARVDFFLTEHGPVVNELNTLPGFTPISMYPQLWQASGLSYSELLNELIALALDPASRAR